MADAAGARREAAAPHDRPGGDGAPVATQSLNIRTERSAGRDTPLLPGLESAAADPLQSAAVSLFDFLVFAASMIGRSRQAITAAEKMTAIVPADLLREPGMTFLQHHQTRQLQMKVRFARWEEILEAAAPPRDLRHVRAMWQYARGRALAARGKVKGRRPHSKRFAQQLEILRPQNCGSS